MMFAVKLEIRKQNEDDIFMPHTVHVEANDIKEAVITATEICWADELTVRNVLEVTRET